MAFEHDELRLVVHASVVAADRDQVAATEQSPTFGLHGALARG